MDSTCKCSFRNEQDKLISMLATTFGEFYIGLQYNDGLMAFQWTSGEAVSYTAWDRYQPGLTF